MTGPLSRRGTRRVISAPSAIVTLREAVGTLAIALDAAGVGPGDRVAGWLPNIPKPSSP